ncbi:mgtA regulatory leader peptide MgtL [Salmonella enterica]|nr:mgtA regulatory leader peptide MgtL [Salmonella enterica subsp. enterica serovar Oakland]ELI0327534.1 mgtA regulatory leader peptide MgtL [Salmonella enterica]
MPQNLWIYAYNPRANRLLTGGDMDPEPTPLPRWRIFLFR